MLGVNNQQVMKGNKRQSRRDKKEIKVTYISSPVKVETSASNFRALVQELTGQDSNVAEAFVEADGGAAKSAQGHKDEAQPWRVGVAEEGYLPQAANNLLKPDYSELHSRPFMEPLNEHLQYNFLSFDLL